MAAAKTRFLASLGGFFLVALDQFLKYAVRTHPENAFYLWRPWIGWEYFSNPGVAFGIKIPFPVIIILTPLFILFILNFIFQKNSASPSSTIGLILILSGAISNFIDRVLFAATIDYLRLATAVINIGDIAIFSGALLLVLAKKRLDKSADTPAPSS